jgi:hypothetical protein
MLSDGILCGLVPLLPNRRRSLEVMVTCLLFGFDQRFTHTHLSAGDVKHALHHPNCLLYVLQRAEAPGTRGQVQI